MMHSSVRSWRRRGRLAGCAVLLACAVSANNNALARTGDISPGNHVTIVELTSAQIAARAHLDRFFRLVLDEHGVGQMDAAVRIAVPGANGGQDMIWVTPFQKVNGQYTGLRHNPSEDGRTILHFERAQVVDWSFAGPDGRLFGNYATRLFLQTLTPEQAGNIAAILADTATPQEWLQ